MNLDDETLMAYADGELDAVRSAEIAAALASDPELARRLERHRRLSAQISGAYAGVIGQPVPERLVVAANSPASSAPPSAAEVIEFRARGSQSRRGPWGLREWVAMAASVALGAVLGLKVMNRGATQFVAAQSGTLVARGALASALERQLASAQSPEDVVLIGLTFESRDGHYCRSFALRGANSAGLACRIGDRWQIPVMAAADASTDGLRQASSPPPAVLQAIEARIAGGGALDAAAEAEARGRDWHSRP